MSYTMYTPLNVWLDPASVTDVVAYIQTYLSENTIYSETEIETIIHDYLIAHPELIGGVQSVNGKTGTVVLSASDINTANNVTIESVLASLSSQISSIAASVATNTANITSLTGRVNTAETDLTNVKSNISDGTNITVEKELNWINGYVSVNGVVTNSSLSKTCVVQMKKGETVTIGTANGNITIIGSTTANSVAVGDSVTVIQRTTTSGAFETYSYTATYDINLVLCVLYSNYNVEFTTPTYYQNELNDLSEKVFAETLFNLSNKEYTVTVGTDLAAGTTNVDVNIAAGNAIAFSVDDPSGAITKYYVYVNNGSDYTGYYPNHEYQIELAADTKKVGVYIAGGWIAANGTITINFTEVDKHSDSIEARADEINSLKDYVPSGITDGYVLTHPVVNGSFNGSGSLFTGTTDRIRTALIQFKANDRIAIETGSFQHAVGMWNGTPSASTVIRNDQSWISVDETIEPSVDGFIVIAFRKSDNSDILPSDFDGEIRLYNTLAYHTAIDAVGDPVPNYYVADDYLKNKAERINTLGKAGDDAFIFITDIHWELNARHSPALIKYLSDKCALHKIFDGGDVSDSLMLEVYKKYRDTIKGNSYHVTGNHDWFTPNDGKALYYAMDSANNNQIGNAFDHYYYVDNVQQKIRYVILNAFYHEGDDNGTGWSNYDADQITWFSQTALSLPASDWDVIVITHFLKTTSYLTGGADIGNAIDSFNAQSGHIGKVLAVFQGNTHWDGVYHTDGGVPVITVTCDKWDLSNETSTIPAEGIAWREKNTIKEQAFDVVILNREASKFTCVRIGAPAQDNIDKYKTDTGFTWIGTLEEREITY